MKTVLVTGANGMLAANIIERLDRCGYAVRATLRPGREYPGTLSDRIRIVEADFKDPEAMRPLVEGCDAVVHAAALTAQSGRDYERYRAVNVEASRRLAALAAECGVATFLHVSTANTIGYGADESRPMCEPFTRSFYARSKQEAEAAVLAFAGRMRVVVVNPTFMIGKYGSEQGSNRVFAMVRRSRVLFCPSGGKNVIDVGEAARGMVLAMERGRNGEKYLICGRNYTYRELFGRLAERLDVRKRLCVPLPDWILRAAGWAGELLTRAGVATELTRANMQILTIKNFYTTDKAFADFGFRPREEIS